MDSPKAEIARFHRLFKFPIAEETSFGHKAIGLLTPALGLVGWLTMGLPSQALTATTYNTEVNTSYYNEYRVCAARLLSLNLNAQAVSQACAAALRPRDVSLCVQRIQKHTQISATDALSTCNQVRYPRDLASCVVGINRYSKEALNPAVLTYCSRSLLPIRFAECVVGLQAETKVPTTQALDTCIDASDRVSGFLPSFIPATAGSSSPTYLTPVNPSIPNNPSVPSNPPGVSTPENPSGSGSSGSVTPANPNNLTPANPK